MCVCEFVCVNLCVCVCDCVDGVVEERTNEWFGLVRHWIVWLPRNGCNAMLWCRAVACRVIDDGTGGMDGLLLLDLYKDLYKRRKRTARVVVSACLVPFLFLFFVLDCVHATATLVLQTMPPAAILSIGV